jgi:hypothetical protein
MAIIPRQDAAGGSTGGAGSGTGDADEPAFTEAQTKAVNDAVNAAVNGALTQHLTRFKKSFGEEIGQAVGKQLNEALSPVSDRLKAMAESQAQGGTSGAAGAGGAGQATVLSPDVQQQFARFEGRTKELEGQLAVERKAREEERAARERDRQESMSKEERTSLAGVLRAKGLPEPQVRAAVALLAGEDKVLGRAEDGGVIFKLQKGTGAARYIDEVPLEAGVDEWLKTDDGKAFMPARQAQGAGGLGSRASTGNKTVDARNEAAASLGKILLGG